MRKRVDPNRANVMAINVERIIMDRVSWPYVRVVGTIDDEPVFLYASRHSARRLWPDVEIEEREA